VSPARIRPRSVWSSRSKSPCHIWSLMRGVHNHTTTITVCRATRSPWPALAGTPIQGDRVLAQSRCVLRVACAVGAGCLAPAFRAQDPKAVTTGCAGDRGGEAGARLQTAMVPSLCAPLCTTISRTRRRDLQRAEDLAQGGLVKILSKGKVTWPWGYARCITDLKFDRAPSSRA
jgi:hypothetical protein